MGMMNAAARHFFTGIAVLMVLAASPQEAGAYVEPPTCR